MDIVKVEGDRNKEIMSKKIMADGEWKRRGTSWATLARLLASRQARQEIEKKIRKDAEEDSKNTDIY